MDTANPERRPLWQRLILPVLGALMIIVGAFGLIAPIIPGILLFAIGFPLLFCFHQTSEDWAIGVMNRWYEWFKRLFVRKTPTTRQGNSRGE
jgi:flagellar biosynthesis protein FliR